jgi:hypothetical protein
MTVHARCSAWVTCRRPAHHALSSMVGGPSDSSLVLCLWHGRSCFPLSLRYSLAQEEHTRFIEVHALPR